MKKRVVDALKLQRDQSLDELEKMAVKEVTECGELISLDFLPPAYFLPPLCR